MFDIRRTTFRLRVGQVRQVCITFPVATTSVYTTNLSYFSKVLSSKKERMKTKVYIQILSSQRKNVLRNIWNKNSLSLAIKAIIVETVESTNNLTDNAISSSHVLLPNFSPDSLQFFVPVFVLGFHGEAPAGNVAELTFVIGGFVRQTSRSHRRIIEGNRRRHFQHGDVVIIARTT